MGGRRADELPALIAGAGFEGISALTERQTRGPKRCLQQFRSQDRAARYRWKLTASMRSNGSSPLFRLVSSQVRH
jgi:hypothetical protein